MEEEGAQGGDGSSMLREPRRGIEIAMQLGRCQCGLRLERYILYSDIGTLGAPLHASHSDWPYALPVYLDLLITCCPPHEAAHCQQHEGNGVRFVGKRI